MTHLQSMRSLKCIHVFSIFQLQEANTGELKCNYVKNTSTSLCMENIFCEPSFLAKYVKQLHPCREEAGCATCPSSSHQLLSFPSLAGQPQHHKSRTANKQLWPRRTSIVLSHLEPWTLLFTLVL